MDVGAVDPASWLRTGAAVVLLAAIAFAGQRILRVAAPWEAVVAIGRAGVQLALLGIVLTGAVSMGILVQRVLHASIRDHWRAVEGWLALGATPRQSIATLARDAMRTALVPVIDQSSTTGIVVLPGAFVARCSRASHRSRPAGSSSSCSRASSPPA